MPTLKDKKTTQDKERQAYAFYVSQGWTPEQAIGIVGNLIRESNLNTTIVGTADDKGSQGIAQWHGDRLKTLKSKYGNNWTDFRNQLEFVDWELKNTEKAAGDKLRKTKGVWEAGTIVSDHYERPKVKFVGDEKRQSHVSDLAMKFKGIKLTPEDMPYYGASYANSVAPYMNQPTQTINYLQIPEQSTNFASVPENTPQKEEKEEVDVETEKVEKESNFLKELENLQKEEYTHLQPEQRQQQALPQVDFMQQYEQVSQFIDNPQVAQQGKKFKLQDERKLVQKDNIPDTKRDLSLMLAEYNNAKKDEQELRTTGQIKNPSSIQYRRNVKTQPNIKQDNISTEQRNAPLNPLQRPLIYLANPNKVLGDLGVPNTETSELDRQAINANTFNPYQSRTDRFLNNAKIGLGYVPEATVNTALAASFMPEGTGALGLVNEALNPLAGIKTSVPDSMKQGLNSQGFLDMFKKAKPSTSFKSEINWNKWNKEIPENSQLIKEYDAIEQQAKANNTWMKNPDGSTFQGTPEQFVQQNSQNFKKAFPNPILDEVGGIQHNYHGSPSKLDFFDESKSKGVMFGKGVYTTPDKALGEKYIQNNPDGNLYELYINSNKPQNTLTAKDFPNYKKEQSKLMDDYRSADSESLKEDIHSKIKELDNNWRSKYNENIRQQDLKEGFDYLKVGDNQVTPFSNYLKSAIGNNGMFDMNNPNIYKSIVPIAGASYLATQGQGQNPPQYQQGGKFTENELAFLSEIAIKDNNGQWTNPGKVTEINSNIITMKGVDYPLLGISKETGEKKLMKPNKNYTFGKKTKNVIEIPFFKK